MPPNTVLTSLISPSIPVPPVNVDAARPRAELAIRVLKDVAMPNTSRCSITNTPELEYAQEGRREDGTRKIESRMDVEC